MLRKQLKRKDVLSFFANLECRLIGMEASGGAHYWARKLSEQGHTVRLMAPQFVKPYVKSNKNDRNDAEAICEAVGRPNMRFVSVKTAEMQAVLALHRGRQGFVKARTAQANQIQGLLAEFGIVIPKGIAHGAKRLPEILEDGENGLPGMMRQLLDRLTEELRALGQGTGGKATLGRISKRGDVYLRTLLIHGARAVITAFERKPDQPDVWLKRLLARRNKNIAAVALAAKTARIAWALLAHERSYQPDYVSNGAGA